jgi:hypothetical protein
MCSDVVESMILKPIALIYCVITPNRWVADVNFEEVPAILHARRIKGHRVVKCHPCEAPFMGIIAANAVRDKKQFVCALYNCGCQ